MTKFSDKTSRSTIVGADIGFPIVKSDFVEFLIYSQFAYMVDTEGWGFTAPALSLKVGPVKFTGEYRKSSDKFLFGYYNNTYEFERAKFVGGVAQTKSQTLESIKAMQGYYFGLDFNIVGIVDLQFGYQDVWNGTDTLKSMKGELVVNDELIPKVSEAKAYYIRNNSSDFTTWKTAGTIMGAVVGLELVPGAQISFKYLWTFEDKNGDGKISGDDETIKTIGISADTVF